jgi:hypothetical protein
MKPKTWVAIGLLLVASAMAVIGGHSQRAGSPTEARSIAEASPSPRRGSTGIAAEQVGAASARLTSEAPNGASAESFERMMAALEPQVRENPNAAAVLADAAYICSTLDERPTSSKAPDSSRVEYQQWKQRFCGHARVDEEREFSSLREFSSVARSLYGENGWIPGQRDHAVDIIVNSTSYRDIQVAADYLAAMDGWDLGRESVNGTPLEPRFVELQRVAIESIVCRYSGTCEGDGLTTMRLCVGARMCRPGITAFDVWEAKYKPDELAAIVSMQRQIISKREEAAARRKHI